jgi:hypothetical protein
VADNLQIAIQKAGVSQIDKAINPHILFTKLDFLQIMLPYRVLTLLNESGESPHFA